MITTVERYVAEVVVPVALYSSASLRQPLESPSFLGVERGYWRMRYEPDKFGTKRPVGISLVIEILAFNREDAEDKVLQAGLKFSQIVFAYAGAPMSMPLLNQLARIGPSGGVLEQHVYFYLESIERVPRVRLIESKLQMLFSRMGHLEESEADKIELAMRWYGASVSSDDPLDGYLSVWIGLESIGSALDMIYHPNGPKAPCSICNNPVGENRDRMLAGIGHIIRVIAPELLINRQVIDLQKIRDKIAHGLEPLKILRQSVKEVLLDMQLVLGVAFLTAMRVSGGSKGIFGAVLPRDYETRPDARASLESTVELIDHHPYLGEWIQAVRKLLDEESSCDADGNYRRRAKVGMNWIFTLPEGGPHPKTSYLEFNRHGHKFENFEEQHREAGKTPISVGEWRARKLSPAWQRQVKVIK